MKVMKIWPLFRPIASVVLATIAWIVAVFLAAMMTDRSGKFLDDTGFCIAGPVFLLFILLIAYALQLRWWESLFPVIIPIWLVCDNGDAYIFDYWGIRITLAFVLPFVISALSLWLCFIVKTKRHNNNPHLTGMNQ